MTSDGDQLPPPPAAVEHTDAISQTFAVDDAALAPTDGICRRSFVRPSVRWSDFPSAERGRPAARRPRHLWCVLGVVGQFANRPTLDGYLAANRAWINTKWAFSNPPYWLPPRRLLLHKYLWAEWCNESAVNRRIPNNNYGNNSSSTVEVVVVVVVVVAMLLAQVRLPVVTSNVIHFYKAVLLLLIRECVLYNTAINACTCHPASLKVAMIYRWNC